MSIIAAAPPSLVNNRLVLRLLGVRNGLALGRCTKCGGALYRTERAGQPQQGDHQADCEVFGRAVQVMRYAQELELAASQSRGISRQRRGYLRRKAKELSAVACTGDPVRVIAIAADKYAVECEKGAKPADAAEMLLKACRALAEGKDPAPIIGISG